MSFDFEWTPLLQLVWRATWQAFALAIIVYCVTSILYRWIAPKWRALLWTLPLARLILLFMPASALSMFHLFDFESGGTSSVAVKTPSATRATDLTPNQSLVQLNRGQLTNENRTAHSDDASNSPAALPQASTTSRTFSLASLLTYIWLVGCCAALCWWIGSKLVLSRLIAGSERLQDAGLLQRIASQRNRSWLRFPIRCFVTDLDLGPSSCGFWRPTILLPRTLWSEFDEAARQAIINHELEHIRRQDVLLLFISRVAVTLHWFNPLAYLIRNQLRREIELAVDAATVATLDERTRHSYGELLIRLAQQAQGPVTTVPMAGKRSCLRARIDQLTTPNHESRMRSALSVGLLLILFVTGLSDVAQTQEPAETKQETSTVSKKLEVFPQNKLQNQYFVTGTVRDVHTGKPVADAEIQILVASEQDLDKKIRKGTTNKAGQYRIEVPLGNVQIWFPALKPGYWLEPEDCMRALTTTPDKPVVVHDIIAQTGPVWNIQAKGKLDDKRFRFFTSLTEVEDDAIRTAWMKGEPVSFKKMNASSMSYLDQKGRGTLTEVGTSGKFLVGIANILMELIVEPGFDNTHVVSLKRLPDSDTTQMIDASGKTATVNKTTVTLNKGVPLLTCLYEALKPAGIQKLVGRVVDVDGNPLAGVRVGVASGTKGGGGYDTGEVTKSLSDGSFSIEVPVYDSKVAADTNFSVVLTKDGFAAMDSQHTNVSKNFTPINFKTLTLRPGYSIPVRVLDKQGNPLPGAEIEPGGAYALRRQAVRTDVNGRALINNLPSGVVEASVRWGTKTKWVNLVVSKNEKENREVAIRLNDLVTPTTTNVAKIKPLAVGQIAPEWDIVEWSDGRQHKLSDYRGQVVVLDFWGLRSEGSVASIPAQKRLAKKFADRGVVFLGIHTPDGEMSQINKLKKSEQWTTPTGIDQGTSFLDGVTSKKYGVQGHPALVVIDADGKIAFRSDVKPSQGRETFMKNLAEASGVNWPPPEDASQEQMIEMMNQLQYTLLSREIERVLKEKR